MQIQVMNAFYGRVAIKLTDLVGMIPSRTETVRIFTPHLSSPHLTCRILAQHTIAVATLLKLTVLVCMIPPRTEAVRLTSHLTKIFPSVEIIVEYSMTSASCDVDRAHGSGGYDTAPNRPKPKQLCRLAPHLTSPYVLNHTVTRWVESKAWCEEHTRTLASASCNVDKTQGSGGFDTTPARNSQAYKTVRLTTRLTSPHLA